MVHLAYKQDFVNFRSREGPPKRWIDMIRQNIGLPLLTAERNVSNRKNWRRRNVTRAMGQMT